MPDHARALGHRGRGGPHEREQRARVGAVRPVPVLVLGLERGADDPGGGVVHEHVDRAELRDLGRDLLGGDVAAQEDDLGSERLELRGGLLGGAVGAEVADDDAGRAFAREPQRDRLPDPSRAAGDEDGAAGRRAAQESSRARERSGGGRGRRNRLPADPRARFERRSRRPSTTRARGRRACASLSSAYASHRVVDRESGDRLANARRDLKSEMRRRRRRRGRRCRRSWAGSSGEKTIAWPSSPTLRCIETSQAPVALPTVRKPSVSRGDVADGDRPVGAEPLGDALHPDARLPAARVRERALRARGRSVRRHLLRRRAVAAARPRDLLRALAAALVLYVNQIGFVYALRRRPRPR